MPKTESGRDGDGRVTVEHPKHNTIHLTLFVSCNKGASCGIKPVLNDVLNSAKISYTIEHLNDVTRIDIVDNDYIPQVYDRLLLVDGVNYVKYAVYSDEYCSVITNDREGEYIEKAQDLGLSAEYVIEVEHSDTFPEARELSMELE